MNISLSKLDKIITKARERAWDESPLGSLDPDNQDVLLGEQPITWLSEKLEQYKREPQD